MVSYNNFLTKDECDYIIKYTQTTLVPYINITRGRNLQLHHINDYTDFVFLKEKLENINVFNEPVFNINLYNEGCFFSPHVDIGGKNDVNRERLKTIIINISEPHSYDGGEFLVRNVLMEQTQGSLFMFNSNVIHEVKEITNGYRYSIAIWPKKEHILNNKQTTLI